jgi:hypothetical protein
MRAFSRPIVNRQRRRPQPNGTPPRRPFVPVAGPAYRTPPGYRSPLLEISTPAAQAAATWCLRCCSPPTPPPLIHWIRNGFQWHCDGVEKSPWRGGGELGSSSGNGERVRDWLCLVSGCLLSVPTEPLGLHIGLGGPPRPLRCLEGRLRSSLPPWFVFTIRHPLVSSSSDLSSPLLITRLLKIQTLASSSFPILTTLYYSTTTRLYKLALPPPHTTTQ